MSEQLAKQLTLLNQNDKMLEDLYHNYAARLQLSDTAFWIFYIAWIQGDGCTQKDICEMWSYSKQTINTALKNLEKQGYLRLVYSQGDRKRKQIRFTDAGREFAEKIIAPLLRAEEISFARLSEKERNDLVALSRKRTSLLQQEIEKIPIEING